MEPLEWSRYAGLRTRWIVRDVLAVSPMPRPEDLETIASSFRTVVSLAAPAEFVYGGHLDPRSLQAVVESHVWLVVGEYNAPTLPELAGGVERARREPVLVHCLRGCGRSPMFAAAWLTRRGRRLVEALADVTARAGCGVETLPQMSVLEAYDVTLRADLLGIVLEHDRDDPRPEYALLLSRTLSWLAGRGVEELAKESLLEHSGLWEAAELLANGLGYSVAGLRSDKLGGHVRLVVTVWVPRRAHPASVRRVLRPPKGLAEKLSETLERLLGASIEAVIEAREPEDVPWV